MTAPLVTHWKREAERYRRALHRVCVAYSVADPVRASADAERWRKAGYTTEADMLDREVAFWRVVFAKGLNEALDDRAESEDKAA